VKALIHAHNTDRGHLSEHKAIEISTHGILFLGTPHQGTDSATLGITLHRIFSIVMPTNTRLLKNLERDSEQVLQQLEQYLPISSNFETVFFYEMYKTVIAKRPLEVCPRLSNGITL
jgi:hypothetical protein